MIKMQQKEVTEAIVLGIKDYFKKNNFNNAVIGLSGGVDSSVAAYLSVKAIGSKKVAGILMPDLDVSSKGSIDDSKLIAKKLKIKTHTLPINEVIDSIKKLKLKNNDYALANAKARARMTLLYYYANVNHALVIGTSDKSEIALGYTTKYGDSASDILVIGDLYKTEVIRLGYSLNVPAKILRKKPTAELIFGQTAEKELGAKYKVMDKILKLYIEDDVPMQKIISKGFNRKIVKNIIHRIRANEHKRRAAMLIAVSKRSFHGLEWRMPITNKFKG
jgi:NAD+ synthase